MSTPGVEVMAALDTARTKDASDTGSFPDERELGRRAVSQWRRHE
jgi:hypothetical protein